MYFAMTTFTARYLLPAFTLFGLLGPAAAQSGTVDLPQTGQTTCYDSNYVPGSCCGSVAPGFSIMR